MPSLFPPYKPYVDELGDSIPVEDTGISSLLSRVFGRGIFAPDYREYDRPRPNLPEPERDR